ncbi:protein LAZY 1 isoform X1 [Vitis riparia]|uniref:protein LAZY 1 isoform X1 n=1 Tax=Vitis riparia TaxID=96939 RepID=UPI00155AF109|nr:protein LAZY 1 isoform X1 [Vitis riparia]
MKLLQWMHHKLRQNSIEPFKDFKIGNSCSCLSGQQWLDDQPYYPTPTCGFRHFKQPQKGCQKKFSECEAKRVEENYEEESSNVVSDLFHGFLAIGTLGSNEPSTPTFGVSSENMTEKETEVTEIDLKLINDELEKFLEAEAKDEGSIESPGRNSHVSIITLCGKQMEAADVEESGKMIVCPLQGYLFGSSIELPETRSTEVKKGKASLGELFQRTKIADEYATVKDEKGEIQAKGTNKSAMHLVKKILRKLQASSRSTCATSAKEPQGSSRSTSAISAKEPHASRSPWPTSDGRTGGDPLSTKRKLRKVLRMFHGKIHPERNTAAAKEFKYEIKNALYDDGCDNRDEESIKFPHGYISRDANQCLNLPQDMLSNSGSSGSREHWIKTDADCKYISKLHF